MFKNLFAKKETSQKIVYHVYFMGNVKSYFMEATDKKQVDRYRSKEKNTFLYTMTYDTAKKCYI
jgi:hypothetical protein